MGKFFSVVGPVVGFALVTFAKSAHDIDHDLARATLLLLAGGIFTIALAVYIRD